jgi:Na+/proline symporter
MPVAALTLVAVASLLFMAAGLWHARRTLKTLEDFITARGSVGVGLSTATLVATVMGVWVLFSPAEVGTFGGLIALVGYALGSAAPILAFIWVGGRMRRLMPHGHSLTEYLWLRFGRGMYALTLLVMVFYMFIFLTAELTGMALAVRALSGIPLAVTAVVVGLPTLVYTAYGGLRSVIFTDALQFLFIFPLLLVIFGVAVAVLGGPEAIVRQVQATAPHLLDPTFRPGAETAVALIIAILAANLFHQGYWQRVWTARDEGVLWKSFALSAVLVLPIVFLGGLLGVMAKGFGLVEHPSAALFDLVEKRFPAWAALALLLLALPLAISSIDSLLNGLVSAFTVDLHRLRPVWRERRLLRWARLATVLLALPAIGLATQGYSVLYLFLIADLVAAAFVFPIFFGLFSRRYGAGEAVASALFGLAAGALFFPTPGFTGWLPLLGAGNLMVSFLAASLLSTALALLLTALRAWRRAGPEYDFTLLTRGVHPLGG